MFAVAFNSSPSPTALNVERRWVVTVVRTQPLFGGVQMVDSGWAPSEQALSACQDGEVPLNSEIDIFGPCNCAAFYEDNKQSKVLYSVRLFCDDGGNVPIAALDLALISEWFRVYLRNR